MDNMIIKFNLTTLAYINLIIGMLILIFWVDLYNIIWFLLYILLIAICMISVFIFLKYIYSSIDTRRYKFAIALFLNMILVIMVIIFFKEKYYVYTSFFVFNATRDEITLEQLSKHDTFKENGEMYTFFQKIKDFGRVYGFLYLEDQDIPEYCTSNRQYYVHSYMKINEHWIWVECNTAF